MTLLSLLISPYVFFFTTCWLHVVSTILPCLIPLVLDQFQILSSLPSSVLVTFCLCRDYSRCFLPVNIADQHHAVPYATLDIFVSILLLFNSSTIRPWFLKIRPLFKILNAGKVCLELLLCAKSHPHSMGNLPWARAIWFICHLCLSSCHIINQCLSVLWCWSENNVSSIQPGAICLL